MEKIGEIPTSLLATIGDVRSWISDVSTINSKLTALTDIGNQQNEQVNSTVDKMVIAAQKLRELNSKGLDLVFRLKGISETANDVLDCGVALEQVITKYTGDLDDIMKTDMKAVFKVHQQAEDALTDLRWSVEQLIAWCEGEAGQLTTRRDNQVSRQRWNSGMEAACQAAKAVVTTARPNGKIDPGAALLGVIVGICRIGLCELHEVPELKRSYDNMVTTLTREVDCWKNVLSRVHDHREALLETSKRWRHLKADARKSKNFGSYILAQDEENTSVRGNLQERFQKVLTEIVEKCDGFIQSAQIDNLCRRPLTASVATSSSSRRQN